MNRGELWSIIRNAVQEGASLERTAEAAGWGYERLSAAIDAAARRHTAHIELAVLSITNDRLPGEQPVPPAS